MWRDDLRCIFYIALKDLRAYYLKPPNISWGMLFPFALILAFAIRQPGDIRDLVPGLLGMTVLFATTSMEAIVITFERRIGALERLMLAPISLPALLLGKVLGGMVFGLLTVLAVLVIATVGLGLWGANWLLLILALILSAAAFSSLGAFVSVVVREVFEAQTLANLFRFPMVFLCGIFVPLAAMPGLLQAVAYALPLTYAVGAIQQAMGGPGVLGSLFDLLALALFALIFFAMAIRILARRLG
ncbi:MAG: ABC transporter permease [Chloroflexi bacterium]|nr:ABC transporter permease [Chloroflexota bacterium]